jgi:hypothetical protein
MEEDTILIPGKFTYNPKVVKRMALQPKLGLAPLSEHKITDPKCYQLYGKDENNRYIHLFDNSKPEKITSLTFDDLKDNTCIIKATNILFPQLNKITSTDIFDVIKSAEKLIQQKKNIDGLTTQVVFASLILGLQRAFENNNVQPLDLCRTICVEITGNSKWIPPIPPRLPCPPGIYIHSKNKNSAFMLEIQRRKEEGHNLLFAVLVCLIVLINPTILNPDEKTALKKCVSEWDPPIKVNQLPSVDLITPISSNKLAVQQGCFVPVEEVEKVIDDVKIVSRPTLPSCLGNTDTKEDELLSINTLLKEETEQSLLKSLRFIESASNPVDIFLFLSEFNSYIDITRSLLYCSDEISLHPLLETCNSLTHILMKIEEDY